MVSKSNFFVSNLFIFIRIRCILNLHSNFRQYQIHNVVQNSESQPENLCFSKWIFSGLIFWTAYNRTVNFQIWKLRKELVNEFWTLVGGMDSVHAYLTPSYNLDLEPLGQRNSETMKKSKSSRSHIIFEVSSIKNFAIFTGKHLF